MTNQSPKVKKTAEEVKADLDAAGRKVDNRVKVRGPKKKEETNEES